MPDLGNILFEFNHITLTKIELAEMPPLELAFVGDAVFELYVRSAICIDEKRHDVNYLHRRAICFVKASAQAQIVKNLADELTDDEKNIVRRGRNSHAHTVPKNASVSDYRYATGFETLIGYLYYLGNNDRLLEILETSYKMIVNDTEGGKK